MIKIRRPNVKDKYEWLCKHLEVTNIDLLEQDGLIVPSGTIYFQFSNNPPKNVDEAIEEAMTT